MTTPVTDDDIVSGALRFLTGKPDVLATLGSYPGTTVPYLFQRQIWVELEGTSSTACLLDSDGGWTTANLHNTARFPRLSVEIWADPIRDNDNNVTDPNEVYRRATAAYRVIDSYLHRPQGGEQMWGSIRTIDSIRLAEPLHYAVPDGDGMVRLLVAYAVTEA